ncbi:hypothetical protein [Pseudoclavibacter sp. 13-3]|uniref:hypothetical protein n=1 Tax=Pseudoclavibacter sp. 13-3 TaxID=2901228 RepID=UPI001E455786|nr:hypothetical protein [Pseudoclavibacter sp. 13-3]MCD7100466.1 hypothetical protein [Pseudoclavibacter sp. 13-3]
MRDARALPALVSEVVAGINGAFNQLAAAFAAPVRALERALERTRRIDADAADLRSLGFDQGHAAALAVAWNVQEGTRRRPTIMAPTLQAWAIVFFARGGSVDDPLEFADFLGLSVDGEAWS